jgi:type IV secretory pathway TraG/TraD family ATPase VirD4
MEFNEEVLSGDYVHDDLSYQETDAKFGLPGTIRSGGTALICPGEQMLSRHILLLGGIGSGKSNCINHIVGNVRRALTQQDLLIVFDTKGDYYEEFYQPGDIVISNDSRASGGDSENYWNVFEEVMIDERVEENVYEIANTIFYDKIHNTSQPFFPNAAKDLFSALMLHMIRSSKMEGHRNNKALRSMLDSFNVESMKNILSQYSDLRAMSSYIEDPKSGQTMGVVSELQQAVREVLIGNFKKSGTLSLRKLVREKGGKVIFIEYDTGIGNLLTPIYKLLIDLAIKEALCRKTNEGNVFFILDEFRLLPNLEHIDDGVNFGRSLGAKFCIGIQNVDQIAAAYGQNLAQSILSGFATTFAFRVNDANSREYIKNLYGRNVRSTSFLSNISSRGMVEQLRESYVVEDADIMHLKVGEAIIGTLGTPPFRFRFKEYTHRR